MNSLIKIYTQKQSKRLDYVLDLIFWRLLGLEFVLVDDEKTAHVIYGHFKDEKDVIVIPSTCDLLYNKGFEPILVPHKNSNDKTVFFYNENPIPNHWDFDLFSSVFYLTSRYEEYKGFEPDQHLRFPPHASILYKTESLEFPLVNIWVQKLKEEILQKWPDFKMREPKFQFISTMDVDSTFQFKEKGFIWSLKGLFNDLFHGNLDLVKDRILTLTGLQKDSFDIFDEISDLHLQSGAALKFFFLLGDYGSFDKNIRWTNRAQAQKIKSLIENFEVGIHPSYASNNNREKIEEECLRLETITGQKPLISRQHFLIHSFPKTYQNLIENEIQEDYTIGYTSQYGFRAGIASPFFFYDLEKDESTELLLFPFCSMDITPLHYYQLTPDQAIQKNREMLQRTKAVNGTFISLWHNESLSGSLRWKGSWKSVYFQLIADAIQL